MPGIGLRKGQVVLLPQPLPEGTHLIQRLHRAAVREEIVPIEQQHNGLARHAQQLVGIVDAHAQHAGPDLLGIRIAGLPQHGGFGGVVGTRRSCRQAVEAGHHGHIAHGAAAGAAGHGDTGPVDLLPRAQVVDQTFHIVRKVTDQAPPGQLELPVHVVMLTGTAVYGIEAVLPAELAALALPERIEDQRGDAALNQHLTHILVLRIGLAVIRMTGTDQHSRDLAGRMIRQIEIGRDIGAVARGKDQLVDAITVSA